MLLKLWNILKYIYKGKYLFTFTSFTLALKRPIHRGFGCKR